MTDVSLALDVTYGAEGACCCSCASCDSCDTESDDRTRTFASSPRRPKSNETHPSRLCVAAVLPNRSGVTRIRRRCRSRVRPRHGAGRRRTRQPRRNRDARRRRRQRQPEAAGSRRGHPDPAGERQQGDRRRPDRARRRRRRPAGGRRQPGGAQGRQRRDRRRAAAIRHVRRVDLHERPVGLLRDGHRPRRHHRHRGRPARRCPSAPSRSIDRPAAGPHRAGQPGVRRAAGQAEGRPGRRRRADQPGRRRRRR